MLLTSVSVHNQLVPNFHCRTTFANICLKILRICLKKPTVSAIPDHCVQISNLPLIPLVDLTTGACRAVIQDYEGLGVLHNLYPKIVNSMGQQIFTSGAAMLMDINSGFMKTTL
jgi:hypothetical protein